MEININSYIYITPSTNQLGIILHSKAAAKKISKIQLPSGTDNF